MGGRAALLGGPGSRSRTPSTSGAWGRASIMGFCSSSTQQTGGASKDPRMVRGATETAKRQRPARGFWVQRSGEGNLGVVHSGTRGAALSNQRIEQSRPTAEQQREQQRTSFYFASDERREADYSYVLYRAFTPTWPKRRDRSKRRPPGGELETAGTKLSISAACSDVKFQIWVKRLDWLVRDAAVSAWRSCPGLVLLVAVCSA